MLVNPRGMAMLIAAVISISGNVTPMPKIKDFLFCINILIVGDLNLYEFSFMTVLMNHGWSNMFFDSRVYISIFQGISKH